MVATAFVRTDGDVCDRNCLVTSSHSDEYAYAERIRIHNQHINTVDRIKQSSQASFAFLDTRPSS